MKPNLKLTNDDGANMVTCAPKPTPQANETSTPVGASIPKGFRRLKWNEMVNRGDFVANPNRRLEKLDGLTGFRAGSFVQPIYRATKGRRLQPKS